MTKDNDEETYSVIFAALKNPVRRRILRMLSGDELTYTQILTELNLDTGHLNYYLDSLGELLAKTDDGKYRLSEFGKAALNLMDGVEEPKTNLQENTKPQRLSLRNTLLIVIPVIALVVAGLILMNVSYVSTYHYTSTGSLNIDDARIIQPNATIVNYDMWKIDEFPKDTLTTHFRTFFQIDIANTNVSLHIQLIESISPYGNNIPVQTLDNYVQDPLLIYNETWVGPVMSEDGTTLGYTIKVPLKSPEEKGLSVADSFALYNTTITNMGKQTGDYGLADSGKPILLPNNTGSFNLQTSYPLIEETSYPYFYFGIAFLALATAITVFLFIAALVKQTGKLKQESINK
jgi:DNA-binding transcriptional ArsR family regulator